MSRCICYLEVDLAFSDISNDALNFHIEVCYWRCDAVGSSSVSLSVSRESATHQRFPLL